MSDTAGRALEVTLSSPHGSEIESDGIKRFLRSGFLSLPINWDDTGKKSPRNILSNFTTLVNMRLSVLFATTFCLYAAAAPLIAKSGILSFHCTEVILKAF